MFCKPLQLLLLCATLSSPAAWADTYRDFCSALADAGSGRLDAQQSLVRDDQGQADVARLTPVWALACLACDQQIEAANAALRTVAGYVATRGAEVGLLPWTAGGTPSADAMEVAAPVLAACRLLADSKLSEASRAALSVALQAMGKRLAVTKKPESTDVRTLLTAVACAGVGQAESQQALVDRGSALLEEWLRCASEQGLVDGHGPTTEAYRLAALGWLRVFLEELPDAWSQAWLLVWGDVLQRLPASGGPLAGAQLFSFGSDAVDACGPMMSLLALSLDRPLGEPQLCDGWFALPFRQPMAGPLPDLALPNPAELHYAWGDEKPYRETICVTPEVSMASTTAFLNASSVPLCITWLGRSSRPTAYLRVSDSCHITTLQRGLTALMNVDFDQVGWRPRTSVWVELVVGPRRDIGRVSVLRQPWEGQPIAVDRLWSIAVETGGHYMGLVPLWAGPAEAKEASERVKPGVLQWTGKGDASELTLRLYSRQATYELRRPEDNYIIGCIVMVRPAKDLSFEDFDAELRAVRYQKAFESRSWRVPKKDEGHPILDKYKPKPKRAYHVERAVDYKLTATIGGQTWVMIEDVYNQEVTYLSIGEDVLPTAPDMQFDTPLLKLARKWRRVSLPEDLVQLLLPGR